MNLLVLIDKNYYTVQNCVGDLRHMHFIRYIFAFLHSRHNKHVQISWSVMYFTPLPHICQSGILSQIETLFRDAEMLYLWASVKSFYGFFSARPLNVGNPLREILFSLLMSFQFLSFCISLLYDIHSFTLSLKSNVLEGQPWVDKFLKS